MQMSVTTALAPRHFAGLPVASWAFGVRVWLAMAVALYAGFWLELESPTSAAITVGILAVPSRGQALEKAGFRLAGTVFGVIALWGLSHTSSTRRRPRSRFSLGSQHMHMLGVVKRRVAKL